MTPQSLRPDEPAAITMLLDNHYGPDRRVATEALALAEAGLSVRIVAWDRRAAGTTDFPAGPHPLVHVHRISQPAPPGGGPKSFVQLAHFGRRAIRECASLIAGSRLVIAHDIFMLPLAVSIRRRFGIPFVYDAHEEYALMEGNRFPPRALEAAERAESFLARRGAGVVVPGISRLRRWHRDGIDWPIVFPNFGVASIGEQPDARWDVALVGSLNEARRPDVLLQVARERPDLEVLVAGTGRAAAEIEAAAAVLPNLTYVGWTDQPDKTIAQARTVYYGLDPSHPYSPAACPNTLYQAIGARRPIVYFGGGEIEAFAEEFSIAVQVVPSADDVAAAIDRIRETPSENWDFAGAAARVDAEAATVAYVDLVCRAALPPTAP